MAKRETNMKPAFHRRPLARISVMWFYADEVEALRRRAREEHRSEASIVRQAGRELLAMAPNDEPGA
jgi:hypothetical protein